MKVYIPSNFAGIEVGYSDGSISYFNRDILRPTDAGELFVPMHSFGHPLYVKFLNKDAQCLDVIDFDFWVHI